MCCSAATSLAESECSSSELSDVSSVMRSTTDRGDSLPSPAGGCGRVSSTLVMTFLCNSIALGIRALLSIYTLALSLSLSHFSRRLSWLTASWISPERPNAYSKICKALPGRMCPRFFPRTEEKVEEWADVSTMAIHTRVILMECSVPVSSLIALMKVMRPHRYI